MNSRIRRISIDNLQAHPDNANRMSRASFAKLVRHIERSGRYEPLVVRPHPRRRGCFQILNGQHRCAALKKLGRETADAIVWDVDDEQADLLLATLNRLGGRDMLDKKLAVLRRLRGRTPIAKLAKLLPQTRGQLERLTSHKLLSQTMLRQADTFAIPLVFFVDATQQRMIEEALATANAPADATTRAARRAAALTCIAERAIVPGESA